MAAIRSWLIATSILAALVSGCGDEPESSSGAEAPASVTGPIIEVQSLGLGELQAFTIKSGDETYEVFVDDDVDYRFPLDHLNEHRISGEPVVVELEERDGRLYALSIEDA